MLDFLNIIMMIIGYTLSFLLLVIFIVFFLIKNVDCNRHFAWFPKYVLIWNKNYKESKFIWLRYYSKTSKKPEYLGLDGSQAPMNMNYVVSHRRRRFFG